MSVIIEKRRIARPPIGSRELHALRQALYSGSRALGVSIDTFRVLATGLIGGRP